MADGSDAVRAVDLRAIATAMRRTKRAVEMRARRETWPFIEEFANGGRKRLYPLTQLPDDVQVAFALSERPLYAPPRTDRHTEEFIRAASARHARSPAWARRIADERAHALDAFRKLVARGTPRVDAYAAVARHRSVDARTVMRWHRIIRGAERQHWQFLLLPDLRQRPPRAIQPEVWDFFKSDFLRPQAPAASAVYDRLVRTAGERGWAVPSLKTLVRRLRRELPRGVLILARQGEEALDRTFPAQRRDRSVFGALEAINADGHRFDVFVRWPDGQIGRPVMLGIQDLYSGKLLAWRVGMTESQHEVRLAIGDVVEKFGIPSHAWFDNGRAFASKKITGGADTRFRFKVLDEEPAGILTTLGIEVHWATPYHGQAKPIERAFRDLCEYVAKHPAFAGAYTGNSPTTKPEDYASRAVPLDEFLAVLDAEIAAHNARPGRRTATCAGRSFDETFAESYARVPVRKASEEQRWLWLLAAESVYASPQSGEVRLADNRYWAPALAPYAGQRVTVRFDPTSLHDCVYVYTLDGFFVGKAECVANTGFADSAAATEYARAKRTHAKRSKQALAAERRMSAAQVADQMPKGKPIALPEAKVVAPMFGRGTPASEPPATGELTPAESAFGKLMDLQLERLKQQQL